VDGDVLPPPDETFVVPYRHNDSGWFDWQPLTPQYPTALWAMSLSQADRDRIADLRRRGNYDWSAVFPFRGKEDAGHEAPWLEFLAGRNPEYPERALRAAMGQVYWHLDRIREDNADLTQVYIHHWQERNPITTEALLQLTLGAPQIIYNGGLLIAPLRYFDAARGRPGLPADIAALVTRVEPDEIALTLVNLSATEARSVEIQAGAFGEHRWTWVRFGARGANSAYPLAQANYAYAASPYTHPDPLPESITGTVEATRLCVELPPGTEIALTLGVRRYVERAAM
jgi:hypothetical protein